MPARCTVVIAAALALLAGTARTDDAVTAESAQPPAPTTAAPQPQDAPPDAAEPALAPAAPPAPERPQGALKQAAWYLMGYEKHKIGYLNRALYALDGDDSDAAYRLEVRRFMRSSLAVAQADSFEESVMWLDASFGALRFRTTRRLAGEPELKLEGTVADGRLNVEAACGDETRRWTVDAPAGATFAGALPIWLAAQGVAEGGTWARSFVNERNGSPSGNPVRYRAIQKAGLTLDGKRQDAWLVVEENGLARTLHVLRADGRLYQSIGQNHNQTLEEIDGNKAAGLKLDGDIKWQNAVPLKVGDGLSSEAYGYRLTLPDYPYVPLVLNDGGLVLIVNLLGDDTLAVVAAPIRAGDPQAADRLYQVTMLFGIRGEPTRSERTVDGLTAQLRSATSPVLGREMNSRFAVVIRDDLGYLFGHMAVWPGKADSRDVLSRLLSNVRWTRPFGREQGVWNGRRYESHTYGYRVELPSDGWRLPQQRKGVPTNLETVCEDGGAVITLMVQPAQTGIAPETVAAGYRKTIEQAMGPAVEVTQKTCTLDGKPAVELVYDARAIDDEPTRTRHVIAVNGNHWYLLTLVSKKTVMEAAEAAFDAALKTFTFGADHESPATDN